MSKKNPTTSVSFGAPAIFLGLVLLSVLVIVLWPGGGEDSSAAEPDAAGASASPTDDPDEQEDDEDPQTPESFTPSESGSLCGLEAHETDFVALFPEAETTWTMINGMQAPASPTNGPGVIEDTTRYCYARTPEGAVLSTANFFVLANAGRDPMTGQWERLIAPGTGRDLFIENIEAQEGTSDVPGQLSAAKVVSYTEDQARVSLGLLGPDGMRVSMTFDLEWAEGDWKIVVDENGESDPSFTVLDDFAGFTPWAAI